MAVSSMSRSVEMLEELLELIDSDGPLPAWVQSKITTIYNDLSDVHGYISGQAEQVDEGKKKGLWANIHARRKAGKRPLRPGEKGYPKTLDIDESDTLREAIALIFEKECKGSESAPVGSPRQRSFCKRMCGHRKKNTGSKTAKDSDSCINQSLRRWRCRCS